MHPLSQVKSPYPQALFQSSQTRFYYSEMQVYSYQGPSENLLHSLTIKPHMLCNLQAQGSSDSLIPCTTFPITNNVSILSSPHKKGYKRGRLFVLFGWKWGIFLKFCMLCNLQANSSSVGLNSLYHIAPQKLLSTFCLS